jgi:hypothetical protein
MVGANPAGTGGVMRPATLRRYATAAGFAAVEILPIQHLSWRFYLLRRPCRDDLSSCGALGA